MTEQMTALAENYPAAAELLRRHGGETLLTYLGQLHHRPQRIVSCTVMYSNAG